MLENKEEIPELSEQISQDFQKFTGEYLIQHSEITKQEELKKLLAERIRFMMDHKFDLLISLLYRIDIDDDKVNNLFAGKDKTDIPGKLADLIIERQLQKFYFRKIYKEGNL